MERNKLGRFVKGHRVSKKSIEALKNNNHKSKRFLGGKHTEKAKRKIGEASKGNKYAVGNKPNQTSFKKGQKPWNKNKELSEEHKRKLIGKRPNFKPWNKGIRSPLNNENHWNWKGGITKFHRRVRIMPEYFRWREMCLKRDNFKCVECGGIKKLEVDHKELFYKILENYNIKTLADAQNCKKLWNLRNGQTLCKDCHKKKGRHGYKLNNKI